MEIARRGWNYLDFENTQNLLGYILSKNTKNRSLLDLMNRLSIDIPEPPIPDEFCENNADSRIGIEKIEKKLLDQTPNEKERISKYIERGGFAKKIKEITGFKCAVCEALNQSSLGFSKKNGGNYIEAHHVIPVSKKEIGSLRPSNIITVCATHHRQFHFGKVVELEHTEDTFHFVFDGIKISIPKVVIPIKRS
jgi:predicted HNH restriction endonuclease